MTIEVFQSHKEAYFCVFCLDLSRLRCIRCLASCDLAALPLRPSTCADGHHDTETRGKHTRGDKYICFFIFLNTLIINSPPLFFPMIQQHCVAAASDKQLLMHCRGCWKTGFWQERQPENVCLSSPAAGLHKWVMVVILGGLLAADQEQRWSSDWKVGGEDPRPGWEPNGLF